MKVSIVMPLHNPDQSLIQKIKKRLKNQKFKGDWELISESGKGLAANMNSGIQKAKNPIIVSLHQDCFPVDNDWLKNLTDPLKSEGVVASVSKVELPLEYWKRFDPISKILSVKEQNILTPLMDEKGCAYKKETLLKVGLFDEKTFRTAGEDFDMYLKLLKEGEIKYPETKVLHYHFYSWKSRFRKELQLSNGFGVLVRKFGKDLPGRKFGFLRAIPILGFPFFFKGFSPKKLGFSSIFAPFVFFVVNLIYSFGFWKGFLRGKQTI